MQVSQVAGGMWVRVSHAHGRHAHAYDFQEVIDMFTWGSMKTAPEELIFCSRQIRTQPGGRPLVHQAAYSVGIAICKIQGDLTQPTNQPTNQPTSPPNDQPTNRSIARLTIQATNQPATANQPITLQGTAVSRHRTSGGCWRPAAAGWLCWLV